MPGSTQWITFSLPQFNGSGLLSTDYTFKASCGMSFQSTTKFNHRKATNNNNLWIGVINVYGILRK